MTEKEARASDVQMASTGSEEEEQGCVTEDSTCRERCVKDWVLVSALSYGSWEKYPGKIYQEGISVTCKWS